MSLWFGVWVCWKTLRNTEFEKIYCLQRKKKLGTLPGFPNSFQTFLSPFPIHPRSWFQGGECVFLITMTASKVESRLPNVGPPTLAWPLQTWPGRHGWPGRRGAKVTVPYCRFNAPSELMFKDGTRDCKVLDDAPFQKNDLMFKLELFVSGGVNSKSKPRPTKRLKGWWDRKKSCGPTTKKSQAQKSSSTVRNYIYIHMGYMLTVYIGCIPITCKPVDTPSIKRKMNGNLGIRCKWKVNTSK